ncbi:uncharacterized protein LOC104888369 isoform X1 [Beta vulgaris subsp. vulgaris]|uniref:uncharacterized protein LOC104888369 isoform X1 n=1 Tax=Beta vulgaris subsp. vulgaris TaxID=3555 RepID=UPI0020376252|nr:uncharacterized protein LOC104888369 isoform X1 [Beta vulgaris subsp. vulgaris]
MICESECRSSEVAFDSNVIAGEFRKSSKTSYTIGELLSLAEVIVTKELPTEFDRSILSELDDACKCAPEHQKLPSHESTGRTWGDSSHEPSERRVFCKLSSKDSKSTDDSWKTYSNLSQRSWQKPGNTVILGSVQNSEHNGILGSWSDSKLLSTGSEVSNLKLQGTDSCLLSRCNEPYRPPCFYKAMHHSVTQNPNTTSKETSEYAESLSKERVMEQRWIKDTCLVLEDHSAATTLISKKNSPPLSPVVSGSGETPCSAEEASEKCLTEESPVNQCLSPAQDPVVQEFSSKRELIRMDHGGVIDAEKSQGHNFEGGRFSALLSLEEAEDIDAYFLNEANLASRDSSRAVQTAKEDDMGLQISQKKELRTDYSAKSKETRFDDILQVDTMGKTASNASAVDIPIGSASSVGPYRASGLQATSADQDWKDINAAAKELHKAPLTSGPDQTKVTANISDGSEIWQSSHCIKKYGKIFDGRGTCRSDSRFIKRFPDYDKSDCNISSGDDKDGRRVRGASTGKSVQENLLGQGKQKEASTNGQKASFSKKTKPGVSKFPGSHCVGRKKFYPDGITHHSRNGREAELDKFANQESLSASKEVPGFQIADETDSRLELNLPDEDSLITIDETCIFDQDKPKLSSGISFRGQRSISPFHGPNNLMKSKSHQQKLNLHADPWFYESQMNSRNLLVNPFDSLAHVNAPPTFLEPWRIHHDDYNLFAAVPSPSGHLPMKSQNYELSAENFPSPRMPQADDYCRDLEKFLSAEPLIYHQLLQIPCRNQEPNVLQSFPLNYGTNVKATMDMGKRGLLAEKRSNTAISQQAQHLQMQRKFAQLNLEAAEQSAYSRTVSNFFW